MGLGIGINCKACDNQLTVLDKREDVCDDCAERLIRFGFGTLLDTLDMEENNE